MKITLIGKQTIRQTLDVASDTLKSYNTIQNYNENLDQTLSNIALSLVKDKHNTTLISNYASNELSLNTLTLLERSGVEVCPLFTQKSDKTIIVNTSKSSYAFHKPILIEPNDLNPRFYSNSQYILTDFDDYAMLASLRFNTSAKIALLNRKPTYRTLPFVEGVIYTQTPSEKLSSLINLLVQNGLNWVVIPYRGQIIFATLKHRFLLPINNINQFISNFFMHMENGTLIRWIAKLHLENTKSEATK